MSLKKITNIICKTGAGAGAGCIASIAFYLTSSYFQDSGVLNEIYKECSGIGTLDFAKDFIYYISHRSNEELTYRLIRDSSLGGLVGLGFGAFLPIRKRVN